MIRTERMSHEKPAPEKPVPEHTTVEDLVNRWYEQGVVTPETGRDDASHDVWFAKGSAERPPTADEERERSGVMRWLEKNVNRKVAVPMIIAMGLTALAGEWLSRSARAESPAEPDVPEQTSTTDESELHQFNFAATESAIELTLDSGHTVKVFDYDEKELWNQDLPEYSGLEIGVAQSNELYQFYLHAFRSQYYDSVPHVEADPGDRIVGDSVADTSILELNKYQYEPAFMDKFEYPSFSAWYGNMEFGDRETVEQRFIEDWKDMSRENGWGDDLRELDVYQWTVLFQNESDDLIEYDDSLTSLYGNHNEERSYEMWNASISEVIKDGGGVCRDYVRISIAQYVLADELYDLGDRGLLLYPMIQYADAKHTVEAFMIATSPDDIHVVGTDSTNQQDVVPALQEYYGTDRLSVAQGDAEDVAVWFTQQFSKDWMDPQQQSAFYRWMMDGYREQLPPTLQGVSNRGYITAEVRLASAAIDEGQDMNTVMRHYRNAFEALNTQLDIEDTYSDNDLIHKPSRRVPQLYLSLRLAHGIDQAAGSSVNRTRALRRIAEYSADNPDVDMDLAMKMLHTLRFHNPDEQASTEESVREYLQALQEIVDRY